jgi:hypothetical protein
MAGANLKTAGERKAEERTRRRKEGLRPLEVWAHPDDHVAVKRYVERMRKRRSVQLTERS